MFLYFIIFQTKSENKFNMCDVTCNTLFIICFVIIFCRKHSSGDLHSRLKTRKLLGVGETDDGDVHRSKVRRRILSQNVLDIYIYNDILWKIVPLHINEATDPPLIEFKL